jgi:hypothetical protein
MIDINPAKQGVDNPQRRYTEKRPFERPDVVLARASQRQPTSTTHAGADVAFTPRAQLKSIDPRAQLATTHMLSPSRVSCFVGKATSRASSLHRPEPLRPVLAPIRSGRGVAAPKLADQAGTVRRVRARAGRLAGLGAAK